MEIVSTHTLKGKLQRSEDFLWMTSEDKGYHFYGTKVSNVANRLIKNENFDPFNKYWPYSCYTPDNYYIDDFFVFLSCCFDILSYCHLSFRFANWFLMESWPVYGWMTPKSHMPMVWDKVTGSGWLMMMFRVWLRRWSCVFLVCS